MRPGSVLVDVVIDRGGCFATSRPTTHHDPTYVVDGVVHYCVANMPGAVPRTSAMALNNATLSYLHHPPGRPRREDHAQHRSDVRRRNIHAGMVTEPSVASELGYDYVAPITALHRT